ncbi:MAG: hypothetical protein ACFFC7_29620 [Candidatus Hermodarchaeota archaeon]
MEKIIFENETHVTIEWVEMFGMNNPQSEYIDRLWGDVQPAFEYLLRMTPRINVTGEIISELSTDKTLELSVSVKNLSPLLHSVYDLIYVYDNTKTTLGTRIGALQEISYNVSIDRPQNSTVDQIILYIGNNFTGFVPLILSSIPVAQTNFYFTPLLIMMVIFVYCYKKRFMGRFRKTDKSLGS